MAIRHKALISNISAMNYNLESYRGHFGQTRFEVKSPNASVAWDKYDNDGEACMVMLLSPKTNPRTNEFHDVPLSTMKEVLDALNGLRKK